MKVAYFSPLPPKRTGIAAYSAYLIPALAHRFELDLFDHGDGLPTIANCPRFDYVADPASLLTLDRYDASIYHVGNQPQYHGAIYRALLNKPGIVVLHDAILYYLIAGGGPGALLKELCLDRRRWAMREWQTILADSPGGDLLHYPYPERFPLLARVLQQALAVIVHSETTRRRLLQTGYQRPVYVVHMPGPELEPDPQAGDNRATRAELGVREDNLLIGAFGFVGRTKRLEPLLQALDRIRLSLPFRLLIVGAGDDLRAPIERSPIRPLVIRRGFVTDNDFIRYLRAVDMVVNLRHPSMGEASLTLIQAMACGQPCIVTDDAWFSELPDDCVWKTPPGGPEIEALAKAVSALAGDEALRKKFGEKGQAYSRAHCLPARVASEYQKIIEHHRPAALVPAEATEPSAGVRGSSPAVGPSADWVSTYFARRVDRALP